ncbi:hypothetical protein [Kitasatospora sp. NPDC057223]|uniref:hypothetical protein n=1 Tax=Kitasatospora sp. NPDC057223 TaxID=3346055 RepID=UPI0036309DDE
MTSEEHLRILGPAFLAEIRQRASLAPPPPPELVDELRSILAPAMNRLRTRDAAQTVTGVEVRSAA